MAAEDFFRKNDQSIFLIGFLISCLFLPMTVWIFDYSSIYFRGMQDRYQKLKIASHTTISWTSFIISIWCLWMFGVIFRNREVFIHNYSTTTRTLLVLYLIHAHSISHRAKVSFSRLLMLVLESFALLWGFFWSKEVEPGVLFILVNGPCVRSMLWITMFDALAVERDHLGGQAVLAKSHLEQIAPYWVGAFGWSLFCLFGTSSLLIVYLVREHKTMSKMWVVVLPVYLCVHCVLSFPFYRRFWKKGLRNKADISLNEDQQGNMDRIDFWLRRDVEMQTLDPNRSTVQP
eukprot:c24018_g1_i1.p1 GENE.c24018_g1_i1~~c24018_g1_i1.p1  ORF type:complete len:319 (+),score=49.01 c24018_g1_i1:91-957(+)